MNHKDNFQTSFFPFDSGDGADDPAAFRPFFKHRALVDFECANAEKGFCKSNHGGLTGFCSNM